MATTCRPWAWPWTRSSTSDAPKAPTSNHPAPPTQGLHALPDAFRCPRRPSAPCPATYPWSAADPRRPGGERPLRLGHRHQRRRRNTGISRRAPGPVLPALSPEAAAGRGHAPRRPGPARRTSWPSPPPATPAPPCTATAPCASWRLHGLTPERLENSTDLPYGAAEREEWLRDGGAATQLAQNCSGKHAAMAATCVINGWPVQGYLAPGAPAAAAGGRDTITDLTGEEAAGRQHRRLRHPALRPDPARHGPRLRPACAAAAATTAPRKPPSADAMRRTRRWWPARAATSPP